MTGPVPAAPTPKPPAPGPSPSAPPAPSPGPQASASEASASASVSVKVKDHGGRIHEVVVKAEETIKQLADRIGKDHARYHGAFSLSHKGEALEPGAEATEALKTVDKDAVLQLTTTSA
jgi:hypothetical protein